MSYLFSERQELKDAPFSGAGMTKAELVEYAERQCLSHTLKDYLQSLPEDQIFTSLDDVFGEIEEVEDDYFANEDE